MSSHASPVEPRQARAGRALGVFVVCALGFTWLLQLPAVLAKFDVLAGGVERYFGLAALAGFGPLLGALLAAYYEGGGESVRALFRPSRAPIALHWYLIALLMSGATYVLGVAAYRAFGGAGAAAYLYLPEHSQHVVALVVVSLVEEPGWRGFALPRLQARMDARSASLLLGVIWAAWHTMMFLLQGMVGWVFWAGMLHIVCGSVLFSWLYNRTGGALRIAIIAHMGAHLNNPAHALPANPLPIAIHALATAAFALVLLACDRVSPRPPGGALRLG